MYHFMRDMTGTQQVLFAIEYNARRKDRTTALILTLFLGSLGIHRFYLNQNGLGALYLLFCWTFVPAVVSVIETLMIGDRVDRFNDEIAQVVSREVRQVVLSEADA